MDDSYKKRKATCCNLVEALAGDLCGFISTQVLQEFYVSATGKFGAADPLVVKDIMIVRSFEESKYRTLERTLNDLPGRMGDSIQSSCQKKRKSLSGSARVAGRECGDGR
jgi:hypothetical protein